ncbi:MAG TPA: ROK family protein [Gemmataceae bacterium]|nr:ROK family protein [Gemmataceae bacterium]
MYLGIEIGGTKLQLGVGPGDGTLAGLWRGPVDVAAGPEGIRRQILGAVPELLARAGLDRPQVQGVGIGFGGPVDDATHTIIKSHQIAGWDGFPLAAWIADMLGRPAVLGNDADVAGLAEALFGAGKGLSPVFYITIGSGIGGGLIVNGEIYRGIGRGAAEIGHLSLEGMRWDDEATVESVASGCGMAQNARSGLEFFLENARNLFRREYPERPLPEPEFVKCNSKVLGGLPDWGRITVPIIVEAAEQGDRFARDLLNDALEALAVAICHVIALLCPRRFVIGGGVSLLGEERLFEPLRKLVAERVFEPFAGCYDIVPAALGEEVVVHGALALARRRFTEVSKEGKAP